MKKKCIFLIAALAALLLSGCSFRTVDQMYCLPKRPESYNNLQSVMDLAMEDHEYSAPLAGENRQSVQMADLDGDGIQEYLLFSKCSSDKPLQILIFRENEDSFELVDTIESTGTSFDVVEYVQMDASAGVELVVGRQVSDQVVRSLSVYQYADGQMHQLLSTSYSKYLTYDMDSDTLHDLVVIKPGQADLNNGAVELYSIKDSVVQRSNEAVMSVSADSLKRIICGKLHEGIPAVFVGSAISESSIITDVYCLRDGQLCNASLSNESGTSVNTLRSSFVYAEDIDNDGVVELPSLISMTPLEPGRNVDQQHLIRWYSMDTEGNQIDKMYTYHNYVGQWYIQLDPQVASRICVQPTSNCFDFYLWDSAYTRAEKLFSVYVLSGNTRQEQAETDERFILHQTETVIYACQLHSKALEMDLTWEDMIRSFNLIRQDWKTGEM